MRTCWPPPWRAGRSPRPPAPGAHIGAPRHPPPTTPAPAASAKKLPPIGKGAPLATPETAVAKPAEAPAVDPKLAYSAAVREIATGAPNGGESVRQPALFAYR